LTKLAISVLLLGVLGRIAILSRTATVRIRGGVVTILQNQGRGTRRFASEEVEFIQTFRDSGDTELQFLLRGKPKLRLFGGRPADELEWAARFLRVALKARTDEAAPLQVDAKAGECQVCGEKMETRVVFCARCRTPHHEECWSYVGQCSTYGCREIRFTWS
jgi:Prokaryotic RING finger family 1